MMIHRVTGVLLVVTLVVAGGLAPFTHMPRNRRSPRQRLLVGLGESRVAKPVHPQGHVPGTNTSVGDRHHHRSVAQPDDAVARSRVRVGTTPAVVEVWEAGIVPDLPARPVPVAVHARPNRPPPVVLAARAPPV